MKITLIAAITVDGFIGLSDQDVSTRWTSKEDARWFSQKTKAIGVCVIGRKTYETFNRPLPDRVVIVQTSDPVGWSKKQARLGQEIKLLQEDVSLSRLLVLGQTQVLATDLPLEKLTLMLTDVGLAQLAICGGATIYTQWLKSGLVDELYLTIEPVIFGRGVKLFNEGLDLKLKLISSKRLNERGSLLNCYAVETQKSKLTQNAKRKGQS